MIWYLIICGMDVYKSGCTFSPPFKSKQQCEFVLKVAKDKFYRPAVCVSVQK